MNQLRVYLFAVILTASINTLSLGSEPDKSVVGPWDVDHLLDTPVQATWGKKQGLVQEVYYDSEPLAGKPTRVFAYYARPKGNGPHPAILLVHGGGGKAFSEWAAQWAKRGYAALAMDTTGNGPGGVPLVDGGPSQAVGVFRAFTDREAREMWTYHAVAAVLRGHALLAGQPEVDRSRIGITGISWGGYLTCIVAGIDHRLRVAVPVYGCGYLADNSAWSDTGEFKKLSDDDRQRWIENFDPASYLPAAKCPMLFVNGTNDFAYPLDSYQKSYRLVKSPVVLCVTVNMPHGHKEGWNPKEIGAFVDSQLIEAAPLVQIGASSINGAEVVAEFKGSPLAKSELHYTSDTGKWQDRKWTSKPARIRATEHRIVAELPSDRPLTLFFTITDERGLTVSNPHILIDKD